MGGLPKHKPLVSGASSLIGAVVFMTGIDVSAQLLADRVPDGEFVVSSGDHLTLVCETNTGMRSAREVLQAQ